MKKKVKDCTLAELYTVFGIYYAPVPWDKERGGILIDCDLGMNSYVEIPDNWKEVGEQIEEALGE